MAGYDMRGPTSGEIHVSYGDQPSHAWLRSAQQFVLLKAHVGAIQASYIQLAREILADVTRLETRMQAGRGDGDAQQDLKLRGICFDPRHGSLVLHLELLHDRKAQPALTRDQIWQSLRHVQPHYGGQLGMVAVTMTPVERRVPSYDPLADHFYEEVRQVLDW